MRHHGVLIAVLAIVVLTGYIGIVIFASEETAKSVGIGYLAVLSTMSVIWDVVHHKDRQ